MPVDPAVAFIVEAAAAQPPPDPSLSVAELRANAHAVMDQTFYAFTDEPPAIGAVTDHEVPVDGGSITVRVYRPLGAGPFAAHVYFHGGGFWLGTLDQSDANCRDLCGMAACVVVSVDYRLAPEHRFPTAAEDCYAALRWTVDHAADLEVDPGRVSVGGASAGGNLAAVVALMARDRGGPRLVFQLLEIPATDMTMSQPSIEENGEGFLLTRTAMEQCVGYYLGEDGDPTDPYASPLLAPDLSGLPPALVMTAEFDPLRDEGEAYARRLAEAGVAAECVRWDGHFHGAAAFTKLLPSARDYRRRAVEALRAAHGTR